MGRRNQQYMILAAFGALVLVVLLVGLVLRNREPSSPPGRTSVQFSDREPKGNRRTDIYTPTPRRNGQERGTPHHDDRGSVATPGTTPRTSGTDLESTPSLARGDSESTSTLADAGTSDTLAVEPPRPVALS